MHELRIAAGQARVAGLLRPAERHNRRHLPQSPRGVRWPRIALFGPERP